MGSLGDLLRRTGHLDDCAGVLRPMLPARIRGSYGALAVDRDARPTCADQPRGGHTGPECARHDRPLLCPVVTVLLLTTLSSRPVHRAPRMAGSRSKRTGWRRGPSGVSSPRTDLQPAGAIRVRGATGRCRSAGPWYPTPAAPTCPGPYIRANRPVGSVVRSEVQGTPCASQAGLSSHGLTHGYGHCVRRVRARIPWVMKRGRADWDVRSR
jgi:hypothetical protein